jgi:hypothetical protein
MSDWIKTRADEIRRKAEEDRVERVRKADVAAVLKAKIQPFWTTLVTDLKEAARRFNEEFPEKERQIDQVELKDPTVLLIRRTNYPAVSIKTQLSNAGTSVNYSISITRRKGTDAIEQQGTFAFSVVDGAVVLVSETIHTNEDVARIFLEPFFEF